MCVVAGVFESRRLSDAAKAIDRATKGRHRRDLAPGRPGRKARFHAVAARSSRHRGRRVCCWSVWAEREDFGPKQYREAVRAAVRALSESGASDAAAVPGRAAGQGKRPRPGRRCTWRRSRETPVYRFDQLKSKKDSKRRQAKLGLGLIDKPSARRRSRAQSAAAALAAGMSLAKDLGNLPSNICTPTYLAGQAQELAREYKLKCQVLEEKDMEKLGMGALLSVDEGSREPAKLVVLQYQGGAKKDKPVVLVGKGITFDTGGISLKPAAEMDEMKYDMSGAGSVLGTHQGGGGDGVCRSMSWALSRRARTCPAAMRPSPGDIVTSMSGQTIEILNTDAEGRLILSDALTYAERFDPAAVVDIATLTGACVIALGHVASGLYRQ